MNKAREKAEQRREKRMEAEQSQRPRAIIFSQDGVTGKVIREEQVDGKIAKREEVLLE